MARRLTAVAGSRATGGGSYSPTPNGTLTVDAPGGAYLRSQSTVARATVEGTLTFGAAPWQHFGFGSDGFESNRYAIFSTLGTSNHLFARLNNNGSEQQIDLGALPVGTHRYRVAWGGAGATDQVQFYLDDALMANLSVAAFPPLYVYFSNGTAGTPLLVDAVESVPPFASTGTFVSCPFDAGTNVFWQTLAWTGNTPAGTTLSVEARTSTDSTTWTAWGSVATNGGAVSASAGRYLQISPDLRDDRHTAQPNRVGCDGQL